MESSLAVTIWDLQAEAGDSAGYGRGARFGQPAWDAVQQGQIDESVKTALNWFYYPMAFPGVPAAYDWSFMAPRAQLSLPSGDNELLLPDDFGGIRGEVIPTASGRSALYDVPLVGETQLYRARTTSPDQTGPPLMALVEPVKGTTHTHGQRWKLSVFPTADQAYTLNVWYDVLGQALSSALPYAYGGAAHAETLKAAVRAAYEQKYLNRDRAKELAPEMGTFLDRLRASIQYDRKFKPIRLGKNLDRSDDVPTGRPRGTIHFDYMGTVPG